VILVGHSFGALIVRHFAWRFPGRVAGLVLVDPVTVDEWVAPDRRRSFRLVRVAWLAQLTRGLAAVGVVRVGLWALLRRGHGDAGPLLGLSPTLRRIAREVGKMPPEAAQQLRTQWSRPRFFAALATYVRALPACAGQVAHERLPAGIPVAVISGALQPAENLAAHRALGARHIVVEGSGHWLHLDQPTLVADAIRELAAQAAGRTRDRL
jgi:pimeloyl-ACP methyl ester carboxylesterase